MVSGILHDFRIQTVPSDTLPQAPNEAMTPPPLKHRTSLVENAKTSALNFLRRISQMWSHFRLSLGVFNCSKKVGDKFLA